MASLGYADIGPQTPELWGETLLSEAENKTFWNRYEGPEGSGMPIIRKDDLTKAAGDTIHTDMVLALTGAGVTGDTSALTGNEEAMKFRQNDITVSDLAHAVRFTEKAELVINYDLRRAGLNQLQKWLAGKLDDAVWSELTGGGTTIPTGNKYFAGDTVSSVDSLDDTMTVSLDDISNLAAKARGDLHIEPIQVEGGDEYFGLVLDTYAALALKKDTNYQAAFREARERGAGNPLFRGALGLWDGVLLFSNNRVPSATNANTPAIRYAKNVFFGGQALSRGFAQYPDWREELFDYGRSLGIATTMLKGEKLNIFDLSSAGDGSGNQALGSIVVYSAAIKP